MAVDRSGVGSSLRLTVQTGLDQQGEPIVANRNYNRLKPNAADEGVYQVAEQLAQLQLYPLFAVYRSDLSQLVQE